MTSVHVKSVIYKCKHLYCLWENANRISPPAYVTSVTRFSVRTTEVFSSVCLHHTNLRFRTTVATTTFLFFLRFLISFLFSIQSSHNQQTRNCVRVQEHLLRRLSLMNFKTFSKSVQINIRFTRLHLSFD